MSEELRPDTLQRSHEDDRLPLLLVSRCFPCSWRQGATDEHTGAMPTTSRHGQQLYPSFCGQSRSVQFMRHGLHEQHHDEWLYVNDDRQQQQQQQHKQYDGRQQQHDNDEGDVDQFLSSNARHGM
jgi:hypothetical protein